MANTLGLAMGGPTVIGHGTDEQKERYLAPILSADEIWCQGFSEPQSGSDLASLKTKAVRDGDEWVVTGQKVWTTMAHQAKWCMLLARTDPDAAKHRGLTYFLMDMEQDGVEIRPLRQITGEAEFNELFIEEARIPDENIVGGENNGWSVAITTLMHERAGLAFALQVSVQIALRELLERAREVGRGRDPIMRQRFAQLYAEAQVLRLTAYRGLTKLQAHGAPGPEGSLGKWHWAEVNQSLTELAMDLAGPARPARRRPVDLPLPARPRQLDRGRDDRDPQEHRRRARARAAAGEVNFDLSEDQQDIKRTAREFLAARYKLEEVRRLALEEERGFTDAQWDEIVELGWPELAVGGVRPRHRRARGGGRGARLRVRADAAAVDVGGGAAARRRRRGGAARRTVAAGTVAQWDEDTDGTPDRSSLGEDLPRRQDRRARRRGGRPDRRHRRRRAALRGRRRRDVRDRAGGDARHHPAPRHRAARRPGGRGADRRLRPRAGTRSRS